MQSRRWKKTQAPGVGSLQRTGGRHRDRRPGPRDPRFRRRLNRMVTLLGVNILIALCDGLHENHLAAPRWFSKTAGDGWAGCPLTQNGAVRNMSGLPIRTDALSHGSLPSRNRCSTQPNTTSGKTPSASPMPRSSIATESSATISYRCLSACPRCPAWRSPAHQRRRCFPEHRLRRHEGEPDRASSALSGRGSSPTSLLLPADVPPTLRTARAAPTAPDRPTA